MKGTTGDRAHNCSPILDSRHQLSPKSTRLCLLDSTVCDNVIKQFAARDVLEHEKRFLVVLVRNDVVEFHNVRMVQQFHDLHLAVDTCTTRARVRPATAHKRPLTLGLIVNIVDKRPVDNFDCDLSVWRVRRARLGRANSIGTLRRCRWEYKRGVQRPQQQHDTLSTTHCDVGRRSTLRSASHTAPFIPPRPSATPELDFFLDARAPDETVGRASGARSAHTTAQGAQHTAQSAASDQAGAETIASTHNTLTLSPVNTSVPSLTLENEPSPRVRPISYCPTCVNLRAARFLVLNCVDDTADERAAKRGRETER